MTARDIVVAFLKALEARDLPAASAMLASNAIMTFPSGQKFSTLQQLVAWSAGRYKFVRKTYDHFDELPRGDVTTVYVRGNLNGEWLDGSAISNVRYLDRFDIKDGKIIRQDVWNDLAEVRP
ncbi:MAG: nuclear transport factor 2 family protein [Rhodospirillaceae bacterium]|nr:nuclear transport factor 2 family protein [Rhodospirillaceae bacterium]